MICWEYLEVQIWQIKIKTIQAFRTSDNLYPMPAHAKALDAKISPSSTEQPYI